MKSLFGIGLLAATATAGPGHGADYANISCPQGYSLVGKQCEQPTIAQASLMCPLGVLQGEQCVTAVNTIKQCPIGSVAAGKECHVVNTSSAQRDCPGGYMDNGQGCIQQRPLPTREVCESGRPDGAGNCLITETISKVTRTYCPAGYFDEGKGCMKTTEYDCSPPVVGKELGPEPVMPLAPPMPMPLPLGPPVPIVAVGGRKKYKRMLGAKKQVYAPIPIPLPPPSKAMHVAAPQPIGPPQSKIHVTRQTCQRKDFAPPIVETFCPEGYYESGPTCIHQTAMPMVKQCVDGSSASNCFETSTAPYIVTCTKGVLVGDQCQWKQPVPIETVCPAGTHLVGTECVQLTQPLIHCPQGMTLEGTVCHGRNYAEPVGIVTRPCQGKECWEGLPQFGH